MFMDLTDEVHVGLNRAEFAHLQNAMGQIPTLGIELLLLRVVARWLERAVYLFFFFSFELFADYISYSSLL
jgi:hypothetical protein